MEKNVVIKTENSSLYLSEHGYSMPIFDIDRSNVVKSSQTQDGASETIASATNNIKIEPIDELEDQPELVQLSVVKQENYDYMDDVKISIIEDEIIPGELLLIREDQMTIPNNNIVNDENSMSSEDEMNTITSLELEQQKNHITNNLNLDQYNEKDHQTTIINCNLCNIYSSFFKDVYKNHVISHNLPSYRYKCLLCKKRLYNLVALRDHVNLFHGNNGNIEMNQAELEEERNKKKNNDRKKDNDKKKNNENKTGTIKKFKCAMCEWSCSTEKTLNTHLMRHIKEVSSDGDLSTENESIRNISSSYKCPYCDKIFCLKKKLIEHVKKHWKIQFKCNLCPYQCHNQMDMLMHVDKTHKQQ